MKVFWASATEQDRAAIFDFIAEDNPIAALDMDERFAEAADRLATHPELGKPGLIAGTRELIPHESYRQLYEVQQMPCGFWRWCVLRGGGHPSSRRPDFRTYPLCTGLHHSRKPVFG